MEMTRYVNGKIMRCGYTTGSCATGAAKAAAMMLLGGEAVTEVDLTTPSGEALHLNVTDISVSGGASGGHCAVSCAVRKDSGDDPDVTNGTLVYASVRLCGPEELRDPEPGSLVDIDGGQGVGRVTRPGLDQPVGRAAINSTPRRMIVQALTEVAAKYHYGGGFKVVVSIPDGERLAARTFNPRLGIVGGISVIGTTGIVEPMSNQALVDTTKVEIRQLSAKGRADILMVPGNYGRDFARDRLGLDVSECVSMSNFIGDAINSAVECGFKRILIIGHIGKLVKLGIGQTFTHSSGGDGRMETLMACALEAGADTETLKKILNSATTDAALDILEEAGLEAETLDILGKRIEATLLRKVPDGVQIEYICFTNRGDGGRVLVSSSGSSGLAEIWKEQ